MSSRDAGDLFDPVVKAENALEGHVQAEHEGKGPTATCSTCRDLSRDLADLAERYEGTYRYSGQGDCRYCGLELLWFATPAGSQLPVDQDRLLEAWPALTKKNALRGLWTTRRRGEKRLLPFSHWSTCPEASRARKRRKRGHRW